MFETSDLPEDDQQIEIVSFSSVDYKKIVGPYINVIEKLQLQKLTPMALPPYIHLDIKLGRNVLHKHTFP